MARLPGWFAADYLERAGFESYEIHRLDHDFQNDYYVIRP